MSTHVLSLLQHHGLLFVFLAVLVEQLGIPIPAIPVLIISGMLARHGVLSLPALATSVVGASLLADLMWFYIGRRYGLRTLHTLCRISLEPDWCVGRAQSRFLHFGASTLVLAKLIPGLSVIAPPLAGATRMAVGRFLILSLAGAAVWAAVGLGAGFLFAPQVGAVLSRSRQMSGVLAAALGTALLGYLCYKGWERHRFYQRLRLARIEVGDLYRALESGRSPLIVDARSLAGRQLQPLWIPTAIHAPIGGMERGLASASRDQDVVFYCSCPDEGASARVARQLLRHGFKRVRLLQGGLEAWTAAGYPVQSIYEIPHAESPATDFVFMDQESRAALASRFNATTYRNTAFRR